MAAGVVEGGAARDGGGARGRRSVSRVPDARSHRRGVRGHHRRPSSASACSCRSSRRSSRGWSSSARSPTISTNTTRRRSGSSAARRAGSSRSAIRSRCASRTCRCRGRKIDMALVEHTATAPPLPEHARGASRRGASRSEAAASVAGAQARARRQAERAPAGSNGRSGRNGGNTRKRVARQETTLTHATFLAAY